MIQNDLRGLACDIDDLNLLPGNPRRGNVDAVARSLEAFGQRKPIVARRSDRVVIAGNHTLQAARALGWAEVAVVWVDDDEVTSKAFALADNRTAELGDYDEELLAELIGEVGSVDAELLAASGWSEKDVADLVSALEPEVLPTVIEPDRLPLIDQIKSKTVSGDIWVLGDHRVMCGDCRNPTDVDKLLNGKKINVAFTSPPYAEQREYDAESGFKPIPPNEYVEWFFMVAANVANHLSKDGSWFVNIKPASNGLDTELYVFDLVLAHARDWGWHFATEFCWERNGVPKIVTQRFKNQFEPVYQFTLNRWKMRADNVRHFSENVPVAGGPGTSATTWANRQGGNGPMFGESIKKRKTNLTGKTMSDAQGINPTIERSIVEGLAYPGNRLPTFMSTHEAVGHTAAFPVGLPAWFIRAYTDPKDIVYDPFCGSGSTIIATHQENRIGYGMELSPRYVDLICARFQKVTGIKPVAEATGREHDFLNA